MTRALTHAPANPARPIDLLKLEGGNWRRLYPVRIEAGESFAAWLAAAGYDSRCYRLAMRPAPIPETAAERRWIAEGARRLKAAGKLPSAADLIIGKLSAK